MNERPVNKFSPEHFIQTSSHCNPREIVDARTFNLHLNGRYFELTVATPERITEVERANAAQSDPDLKVPATMLPTPNVDDFEALVNRLSIIPLENLQAFLVEVHSQTADE